MKKKLINFKLLQPTHRHFFKASATNKAATATNRTINLKKQTEEKILADTAITVKK